MGFRHVRCTIAALCCVWLLANGQQSGPLQIGDILPETVIGQDFRTGKPVYSCEFADGRLVILDFWYSGCASCIASFPKLEKLQQEFPDSIRILLVNSVEDSTQLARRMQHPYFSPIADVELPLIVGNGALKQLFPYTGVPHHVWIGPDGRVVLIGSSLNTNGEKIRAYLAGDSLSILNNTNLAESVTTGTSLHGILGLSIEPNVGFGEPLFSTHLNGYSPTASARHERVSTPVPGLLRDTYINHEVAELYAAAFAPQLQGQMDRMVYGGPRSYGSSNGWADYLLLEGIDTPAVTSAFFAPDRPTDRQFVQSRYCYEVLYPGDAVGQSNAMMLEHLNRYFGARLGIYGRLAERDVPCYVLRSADGAGIPEGIQGNTALKDQLGYLVFRLFSAVPDRYLPYLIDETGMVDVSSLTLPAYDGPYSLEDIVSSLREAGIECRQEIRTLKFIAIGKR